MTWRERDKISRYAPHRQPSSEQPRGPSHAGCHGPSWLEGSQSVILLTDCRNGREKSQKAASVQLLKSVERGCDGLSEREKGQSSTARYFYQRSRRKLRSRLLGWPVRASFSLSLHVLRAFHSLPLSLPVTLQAFVITKVVMNEAGISEECQTLGARKAQTCEPI